MNERIRYLVEQTVKSVDIVTGNEILDDELDKMYIPDCFAEKFAELIVAECVKLRHKNVIVGGESEYNRGRRELAEEILKHFGVKE